MPASKILGCVLLASACTVACAGERQTVPLGPTYEIVEPSALQDLQRRLEDDRASGLMQQRIKEGQERAWSSLRNPRAVDGLRRADAPRTWYYDPTITATQDIVANGTTIVRKGTTVNPLDRISWSQLWIFIDGRDPAQVRKAGELFSQARGAARIILTGGSFEKVSRELNTAIYFDQQGLLVRRLGISATPATVRQDGRRLRLDEVKL